MHPHQCGVERHSEHIQSVNTVFAKCCYGIELGRSEVEDRYILSYDDAVSYWKNFDARVYQIA